MYTQLTRMGLLLLLACYPALVFAQTAIDSSIELAVTHDKQPAAYELNLESFEASFENGAMAIHWATLTELNNARFEVERAIRTHSKGLRPWMTLAFVTGGGTTDTLQTYAYYDEGDITDAAQVMYRLKQVSFDGSATYSEVVEATLPAPKAYAVSSYPDPYTAATTIEYAIPKRTRVRLTIYDASGKLVKTLVSGTRKAGRYRETFNAADAAPGLYMYRLETGGRVWVEPVILVE
ncbi:MAG: T9SS type A sorting domain-containing protein [Bacteroidota bacterium]